MGQRMSFISDTIWVYTILCRDQNETGGKEVNKNNKKKKNMKKIQVFLYICIHDISVLLTWKLRFLIILQQSFTTLSWTVLNNTVQGKTTKQMFPLECPSNGSVNKTKAAVHTRRRDVSWNLSCHSTGLWVFVMKMSIDTSLGLLVLRSCHTGDQ